jgi:hypothetical protein
MVVADLSSIMAENHFAMNGHISACYKGQQTTNTAAASQFRGGLDEIPYLL